MSSNKRIRKPRARTAKELLNEPGSRSAADLKREVHRLEVEIACAHRIDAERRVQDRDILRAPEHLRRGNGCAMRQRLTHAQSRRRRARLAMQVAMFLTSAGLLAGVAAWLYRFWRQMH